MSCVLCAGVCRTHPLFDEEAWKPEPGSEAYRAAHDIGPMFSVAARYCDLIEDGRSQADVLKYLKDEVQELDDEVVLAGSGGEAGPDGIFGEAIDIIACCVDMIRREYPDLSIENLEALAAAKMRDKCEKWLRNVEARKYPHQQ